MTFSDFTTFAYFLRCPQCGSDWAACAHATPEVVLELAELAALVKSTVQARAADGNWPAPTTTADYLAWIEHEARGQEEQAADQPEARGERIRMALAWRAVACHLRCLGVRPSRLPWEASHADLR
jgi:hypothetical protein